MELTSDLQSANADVLQSPKQRYKKCRFAIFDSIPCSGGLYVSNYIYVIAWIIIYDHVYIHVWLCGLHVGICMIFVDMCMLPGLSTCDYFNLWTLMYVQLPIFDDIHSWSLSIQNRCLRFVSSWSIKISSTYDLLLWSYKL